jgi:archaellin
LNCKKYKSILKTRKKLLYSKVIEQLSILINIIVGDAGGQGMKIFTRKAQTGVVLIILFIAALFVAAVVAGIFVTTENDLQAKAKQTGDQVTHDVSAIFFVMDIVGTDGSDGLIDEFRQIIKLPPGSQPVNLDYLNIIFNSENLTSSLTYAGIGAALLPGPGGYNTWTTEEIGAVGQYYDSAPQIGSIASVLLDVDLDLDGTNDQAVVCEDGRGFCPLGYGGQYVAFILSTAGTQYVQIVDSNQQAMSIAVKNNQIYGNTVSPIGTYGYMTLTGSEGAATPYTIFVGQLEVFLAPNYIYEDPDGDHQEDALVITNTQLIMFYSTNGDILTQLNDGTGIVYSHGGDLSGIETFNTVITLTEADANPNYGTITLAGTTTRASYIDEGVTFLYTPYNINKGFYSVSYLQRSVDYQEGVVRDGDVVRLYYELPAPLPEDEEVHVTLITRGGGVTRSEFFMPNIIAHESVTVYPS